MMKFMFRALVSTPTFCDPWCRTSYMFFLDHEHPERRDWRTTCAWPENFLPLKLWMFFGTSTMRIPVSRPFGPKSPVFTTAGGIGSYRIRECVADRDCLCKYLSARKLSFGGYAA